VSLPQLVRHRPELGVAERLEVVLDRVDLVDDRLELAQRLTFASAKDVIDDGWHLSSRSLRIVWLEFWHTLLWQALVLLALGMAIEARLAYPSS
jgi:hypothetical protein